MEWRYLLVRIAAVLVSLLSIAEAAKAQEHLPQSSTDAHAAFISKLKRCIFEISAKTVSAQVFATGTGFVVSEDGLAFTNFHVLHGASAATATFTDDSRAYGIELLAVNPELDLALIRIVPGGAKVEKREFIPVSNSRPVEGTTVWAIGYPKRLGFSVSKGVVNGVRSYLTLPAALRAELKYSENSEWIQTDATINAGNSGGPLVASDGSVVGVNTWVWLDGSNLFFAISASHLRPLMAKASDPPLGFDRAAREHGTVRTIIRIVPRLEVMPVYEPAAAIRRSLELDKFLRCSRCGGDGTAERREVKGAYRSQSRIVSESCTACKATGCGTFDRSAAGMKKLVTEVVQIRDDDPERLEKSLATVATRLRDALPKVMRGTPTWWNDRIVSLIGQGDESAGEPVWYYATMADDLELPGVGRARVVRLKGSNTTVVLTELQYVDAVPPQTVFGFGYFAGQITLKDGTLVPVIQGGILVRH